jgi:hypothetical protein
LEGPVSVVLVVWVLVFSVVLVFLEGSGLAVLVELVSVSVPVSVPVLYILVPNTLQAQVGPGLDLGLFRQKQI